MPRLSVSKIKTFKSCKLKYKFAYIDYLPQQKRDYLVYGNFAHKTLELFHQFIIDGDNRELNVIMTSAFKLAKDKFKDEITKEQLAEARKLFSIYLKNVTKLKINNEFPNVLSAEKGFYIDFDGKFVLNGVIDRVQLDSDKILHVQDYKTTKKIIYLKKDDFQLQVYAYTKFLEDDSLENIRASYILLKHDFTTINKLYTRALVPKLEKELFKNFETIDNEKLWRPETSYLCRYCDYIAKCRAGQTVTGFNPSTSFGEEEW